MCKSFLQPYRRCITIIKPLNYIWQDFEKAAKIIYYFTFLPADLYNLFIYLLFARYHKCDNHMKASMRQDSETNIIVLNAAVKYKIQRNTQKTQIY